MTHHPDPAELTPTYTGHDVVDEQGQKVGKVIDVLYDEEIDSAPAFDPTVPGRLPSWLVVDPGLLRAAHYVPVAGSYRSADGSIVIPWDRDWVKSAARAGHDHVVTRETRDELMRHYSLSD